MIIFQSIAILSIILQFCETSYLLPRGNIYNDSERIVGGVRQDITGRNFQVAIVAESYLCGGALIKPDWVVTAAHCAKGVRASGIQVRGGSNYYYKGGVTRNVARIKIHQKYNAETMENDIALLKLSNPMPMSKRIGLIGLARHVPKPGSAVLVSGYGLLKTGGTVANHLMMVRLKYISTDQCSKMYEGKLRGAMICAGVRGKDSCQGDSGGPLTSKGYLLGVVSWGYDCADPDHPGVYASIPEYRKWIIKNWN